MTIKVRKFMFENPCFGGYMNTLNENKKKTYYGY